MKSLVVYFTPYDGNTKLLAEKVALLAKADIYRIEPVNPYPEDYFECNRRARAEYEANARPEIKGPLPSLNAYDVIYLGFPNWYRSYPKVVATFLDNVSLAGKIVKPFCTNEEGGFGIGELQLRSALKDSVVKNGFSSKSEDVPNKDEELASWIEKEEE